MPAKPINKNNKTNDIFPLKKNYYISFNSTNPFKCNPYAFKLKKTIRLEKGIVEDIRDGIAIISCRN